MSQSLANIYIHLIFSTKDRRPVIINLARTSLSKAVEEVKKGSSKWLREHIDQWQAWQTGYGAFSVSESNLDTI